MQIAFIAPKSAPELSASGHYHFVLPSNLTPYYKNTKKFIMLDNGIYEGEILSVDSLLKLAKENGVNEIAAPDYLRNYQKTIEQTVAALPKLIGRIDSIAVTPQGATIREWLQCYQQMIELDGVNTICITKALGKDRPYVIAYLIRKGLWKPLQFNYHLFGLDYLEELDTYRRLGAQLRSVDTSMPFSLAVAGKSLEWFTEQKIPRVDLVKAILTSEQKKLAIDNMNKLKELVNLI